MQKITLTTMDDLRAVIIEEIQKLRNKESTPAVANAIFNGTGKIMSSVKLEIEYNRYIKKLKGSLPLRIGMESA